MDNDVKINLLPCPFCGEPNIADIDDCDLLINGNVGCTNCSAQADYFHWNLRHEQAKEPVSLRSAKKAVLKIHKEAWGMFYVDLADKITKAVLDAAGVKYE